MNKATSRTAKPQTKYVDKLSHNVTQSEYDQMLSALDDMDADSTKAKPPKLRLDITEITDGRVLPIRPQEYDDEY